MDTWKHKLKNNRYMYFTVYICKHIELKVGENFQFSLWFSRGRILRRPLKHLERCRLLAQALGKAFSSLLVVTVSWEHTETPAWHQCHPLPEVWEVDKSLCPSGDRAEGQKLPPEQGRAAKGCHWATEGKWDSEVILTKCNTEGSVGWRSEVPNRAVGVGTSFKTRNRNEMCYENILNRIVQVLCDIFVKGHI